MKCSICKQEGHNKRSCKTTIISDTANSEIEELKKEIELLKAENENLKSQKYTVYSDETPFGILQSLAETTYKAENDFCIWKDSPLKSLDKLKSDCSGKVGELLIEQFCKKGNIPYIYNGDTNSTDGTYDIIINEKKVEIKTAKLGKQKGFQHENLRMAGYDYLLFLDVCPSYYYITIIPKFDLRVKSAILGKKAHLRKGTSDVFKLDFNKKILDSLIPKAHTMKVLESSLLQDVLSFIAKII